MTLPHQPEFDDVPAALLRVRRDGGAASANRRFIDLAGAVTALELLVPDDGDRARILSVPEGETRHGEIILRLANGAETP